VTYDLSEKRLKSREAHDDRLNQSQVGVGLECLDEYTQQLLHFRVAHRLADAAEHDDGARLQCRVVLERKAARQVRPVLAPLAVLHLLHTTLNTTTTQFRHLTAHPQIHHDWLSK